MNYFGKDLTKNLWIPPKGTKFLFNVYKIKPCVVGIMELEIPYQQLKALLK